MDTILPQIAAVKGIALLTVEPMAGLAAVTTDSVQLLAKYITQYQKVIYLDRTANACQYKIFNLYTIEASVVFRLTTSGHR